MKISLLNRYFSLLPFDVDLPKFTLVTGLNGSGKSQLLSGIEGGNILCDLFQGHHPSPPIVQRFTAADFTSTLSNSQHEQFNSVSSREDICRKLDRATKDSRAKWIAWGEEQGLSLVDLKNLTSQAYIQQNRLGTMRTVGQDVRIREIQQFLASLAAAAPALYTIDHRLGQGGDINDVQNRLNMPYFVLNGAEFWEGMVEPTPFFFSSITTIFSRYRDLQLINNLRRLQKEDGESTEEPLTLSEFRSRYGPPPWEILNETLRKLGLAVSFLAPKGWEFGPYTPALKTPSDEVFSPENLSSGEKIILRLALCGYQVGNRTERIAAPKLLLLDEVDAPLHPDMVKTYLQVIKDVLVDTFDMHVVVTTHSPTTVALFPDDTIYVMKSSVAGPKPQSKSIAIASLLHGVPALAVSIQDRRQVFAESPVEAENLDRLYQLVRHDLSSPISLQFIPTGSKHENSSRDIVQRIVGDLAANGNDTVFGLIDWDRRNQPTERIKVLAHGRRYSLENVILDPLIIAFAIYRLHPNLVDHYELDASISFRELQKLTPGICQAVVDKVVARVFKGPQEGRADYAYCGGLTLSIENRYMLENGHNLEKKVCEAFPVFETKAMGGSGKLTNHMIESVLSDYPDIIPREIADAFSSLLAPRV